jgi:hypothetical protein
MAKKSWFKVKGLDDLMKLFRKMPDSMLIMLKNIISENSILLATHLKRDRMTGGTNDHQLGVRSGQLRSATRPKRGTVHGTKVMGGVTIGTNYAAPHFGPAGKKTKITPKTGRYLTIPLPAAMTASGVVKGRARDEGVWGKTFVAKSKAGNLIIFGKGVAQKGGGAGEIQGSAVPLFVLKESVTIKARIDPMELVMWIKKLIIPAIEREIPRYARRNKT